MKVTFVYNYVSCERSPYPVLPQRHAGEPNSPLPTMYAPCSRVDFPYHNSPSSVVWPCPSSATSPVSSYRVRRSGSDSTEWTKDSAWKRPFASSSPGHLSGCCIRGIHSQRYLASERDSPLCGLSKPQLSDPVALPKTAVLVAFEASVGHPFTTCALRQA